MTDKDRREIAQLRGAGMGDGRIARQLGIPLSTAKSYCLRNSVIMSKWNKQMEEDDNHL